MSALRSSRPAPGATPALHALRGALVVDAAVFLGAAVLNLGLRIPLGFTELGFPVPVWQAGVGEAVIGIALISAGVSARRTLSWVAFWLSVVGIAFGLRSSQVHGPAREIHVLLVPLAILVLGLLLLNRRELRARTGPTAGTGPAAEGR